MKTSTLPRVGRENLAVRWLGLLAIALLLPGAASLQAQTPTKTATTVTTLGGGPQAYNPGSSFGYSNSVWGVLESQFHTPLGIAFDGAQDYLYVADRDNNAIRLIDSSGEIFTFAPYPPYVPTNVISQPVGVAVDALSDVFVLNHGNGANGNVVEFDWLGDLIATNMTGLTNASGIALDTLGDIYVTASNTVFKITHAGVSSVVATIAAPGASLQGIVVKRSGTTAGLLAVCDSGRNGIYLINPTNGVVTTNAGFNGVGDGTGNRNQGILNSRAQFFQPSGLAEAGDGSLIVADFGNNRVKIVTVAGITTNLYGVSSNYWWTGTTPTGGAAVLGWSDGAVWEPDGGPGFGNVQARMPFGVAIGPDGTIYTTEDYYHIIRKVTGANIQKPLPWPPLPPTGLAATASYKQVVLTWNPSLGATNYNVKRSTSSGGETSIASTSSTNFTDLNVVSGTTYYYVVSAVNASGEGMNSAEVSATPPPPFFNNPTGIALDPSGASLYIADYTNNAVEKLNLLNNQTTHFLTSSNGISHPVSVMVDTNNNLYVLNQNSGTNGSVLEFDIFGNLLETNVTGLNQPTALTMDANGNIFITEQAGNVIVVSPSGLTNTIADINTNANVQLAGIALFDDGTIAVSDAGNHVIWTVNAITKTFSRLTGQLGISGTTLGSSNFAKLYQPRQISRAGGDQLVVADSGNNRLVTVTRSGSITNVLVSTNSLVWFGTSNDPVAGNSMPMLLPVGIAVSGSGLVYDSEPTNAAVRQLTAAVTPPPAVPSVILPAFAEPQGIAFDSFGSIYGPYGVNNLFIADPANNTVQVLDLDNNFTSTFLSSLDGITNPSAVFVDTNEYVYVLNQNSGTNGYISAYDIYGNPLGTITTGLKVPTAFTLDAYGNFYITEQSGRIRAFGIGISNAVIATITNANVSLQGIALFDNGTIAVSDAGNHVIWTVNAVTKNVSLLTGQLGISGTTLGASNFAMLNQPHQIARAGNNQLVVADYGNNRLVTVSSTGYIARALDSTNASVWFGLPGDPIASSNPQFVPMILPFGVAVGNGTVFASETYFDDVRGLNSSGVTAPASNPGVPLPIYSEPAGIALNTLGTTLFITDFTNNTIWALNLNNNATSIFLDSSNGIYQPVDVAVDNKDDLYVLNQGTGGNGSILEFDKYGNLLATNAAALSMPTAMKLSYTNDIYVAELTGLVQKFNVGSSNTVAVINTNGNVRLQGITVLDNRSVVVSDAGNHVLWKIAPGSTNAVLFTGIIGSPGATLGAAGLARLNIPMRLATAYGGLLAIADSGNNRVVIADNLGTISSVLNSTNANLWFGRAIDPVSPGSPYFVPMLSPVGLAIGNSGTVFVSESIYKVIRGLLGTGLQPLPSPPDAPVNLTAVPSYNQVALTWSASLGATNYYIKRAPSSGGPYSIIGTNNLTSYTDASVINGATYYYVISAAGLGGESFNNSPEVSATVPIPPPPAPTIGWFDYEFNGSLFVTVFHPVSGTPSIAYNDLTLAIEPNVDGAATFYTDDGSLPDPTNGSSMTPPSYHDGTPNYQIPMVVTPAPDLKIKAVNMNSGGSSPVVTAEFIFQVASPSITGNNAAQFTVNDVTTNAIFQYTTDGTDPRTNGTVIGPITATNGITLSLSFPANTNLMLFQIVGFKANYQTSSVVSQIFSISNFMANTISFGFASGEASSDFVAAPGQTFYAPVTLTTLPGTVMYSLQFNVTVTNAGPNPGPALATSPTPYGFASMLMKPIPGTKPVIYEQIPPAMFVDGQSVPNPVLLDGSTDFSSLLFTNNSINLLGVGWVERAGATNLYDTTKQTLITYSMAHDDMFPNPNEPNDVIIGGYAFTVPMTATNRQTYQIQIGRPSATTDGIGTPGSSVFISAPTNGSLTSGAINAIKNVTVGSRKYLVGNVYPFRWFNAGDFGNTNLQNADVEQVFEAAVYKLNSPAWQAPGSDFFDAMDSCGLLGALDTDPADPLYNTYTNISSILINPAQTNPLFDGNDTTINQVAFGDGNLDICDVYVTYRRSLDPSLYWFQRFWMNGVRVAEATSNVFVYGAAKQPSGGKMLPAVGSGQSAVSVTNTPAVRFSAGDFQASAGQTIQIPVTAAVFGLYPLRVAMLNISVVPLDGSPALTTPISFSPSTALGTPSMTDSDGPDNYAAAWLNSTIAGLSNNATIGTLTITLPANATSLSAYAVHFDHASASPNGLASFPKKTSTGLITLSSRANSSYSDGIPDSWRLRWFGTIYNQLSVSNACPSGDGINNWMKYVAGVDPNTPNDFPSLNPNATPPSGAAMSIYWPTVSGKQYAILSSASLFPGNWTTNTIITGNGANMEFDDNSSGAVKFYRVLILP